MDTLTLAFKTIDCELQPLKQEFDFELKIYGSAANGLFEQPQPGTEYLSSDLDLTLNLMEDPYLSQLEILFKVQKLLKKAARQRRIQVVDYIRKPFEMSAGALLQFKIQVPIIGSTTKLVLDIDILVDKQLELVNTELICLYGLQDERFLKVALVLKGWNRQVNSDKNGRLNSFSIYMLLIAYMLHKGMMVNL